MITDLANLGPSLRGTADLGGGKAKAISKNANAQTGKPETASSFDQILQKKVSDKPTDTNVKSDKDVRASQKTETTDRSEKLQRSSDTNEPRTARKENRNGDEPGSVKEESESEKVGKKANSSSQSREQVMLEFMDSMESEFSIPPARLVEAMTTIPESDQLTSPEDSASQVIAQLDLPSDQEQKALALYVGMLAQLKQAQEPAMKPVAVPAFAKAMVAPPVLMTAQQKRAALNESLDQMNQRFFVRPEMTVPKAAVPPENLNSLPLEKNSALETGFGETFPKDQLSLGERPLTNAPAEFPKGSETLLKKPAMPMPEGMQKINPKSQEAQALAKSLAALSVAASALDQGIKSDLKNLQQMTGEPLAVDADPMSLNGGGFNANSISGEELKAMGFGVSSEEESSGNWSGDSSSNSNPQFSSSMQSPGTTTHAGRSEGAQGAQSFGALMAGAEAKNAAAAENPSQASIQQIMKQAQYMIRKGGGETRIQAAPEGVGQIHMKVAIQDGKVNLEMSAETAEAKKLIESSLSELRSSLGQHQLTVDQVKVDVGNQLAGDSKNQDSQNQQKQMDQNQDQSKNHARQFWNEFGNGGGGFDRRGTFFDNPGIKAYGGSNKMEPLTPNSGGNAGPARYAGSGKGRGLNLVA